MEYIEIIGQVLFGGYFLFAGINHFTKVNMMTEYTRMHGIPAPKFGVLVSGALLVFGGSVIVLGYMPYMQYALLALIVTLIPIIMFMHPFWKETEPQSKMNQMQHMLKGMALLGATFMLYGMLVIF